MSCHPGTEAIIELCSQVCPWMGELGKSGRGLFVDWRHRGTTAYSLLIATQGFMNL